MCFLSDENHFSALQIRVDRIAQAVSLFLKNPFSFTRMTTENLLNVRLGAELWGPTPSLAGGGPQPLYCFNG